MSSKKKSKRNKSKNVVPGHPPYIRMIYDAIALSHHAGKGASRQLIAKYIKNNNDWIIKSDGAMFNSVLRRALDNGIKRGTLIYGDTKQRFKLTDAGRKERKMDDLNAKIDVKKFNKMQQKKAKESSKKSKKTSKKTSKTKKTKTKSKSKKSSKKSSKKTRK